MSDRMLRSFRGGRFLLAGFLGLLLLLFVGRWGVVLYVDLLWFRAEGIPEVFWTRAMWEWGARVVTGAVTALVTWANLQLVARSFQGLQVKRRFGDLVIQEQLPGSYVAWAAVIASVFVGFWCATVIPGGTGLRAMLALYGDPWGTIDPILGRDLGFYVFLLPLLEGAVAFGLVITVLIGALSAGGYAATGAIGWTSGRLSMSLRPARHFAILAGAFLIILGLRFYLVPFGLLMDGNSGVQNIFGYADHQVRIPGYRTVAFLCLAAAAAVFWGARRGWLLPAGISFGAVFVAAVGLGQVYPALVQRFQVQPNEIERETPYIRDAVAFTRLGFALDGMDRQRLDYSVPDASAWEGALERLTRLPVWTDATLLTTFRQLEARFQYYDFREVAFDRYPSSEGVAPIAASVREVNPTGIPDPNWQNLHLRERYISGMGAVAGQLSRHTEGRLPMFLTAIPPEFRPGPGVPDQLQLTRPSVFIGSRPQLYSVINATEDEFLNPSGRPGTPGVDYPNGIPVGSLFRTLALAWRFQDPNVLLASEVGPESRLVYRRQAQERVIALAPFLLFPEPPVPIVADGRVFWILEGFTASESLPLSGVHRLPNGREVNYLRNSVKATVDAVTGDTRLYMVDPADPLIQAYARGFPTLFRDLAEMPAELAGHLRYSRVLLELQAEVLTRFHQESPPVFHGQQDRWDLATELSTNPALPVAYRAEYGLLDLPGPGDEEAYVLSTVFVPQGRQNLASFLAARWVPGEGGRLSLWDAPVEQQILGPGQIEAMVEQDPEISQQFSLWRQGGSQVWTGHLHLVPVENTLYYLESVFLAADVDAIPEIRRFVVSDGRRVVMETSIERALSYLAQGALEEGTEIDLGPGRSILLPSRESASSAAVEALDRAEERLREGDWEGFGRGLEELRRILTDELQGTDPAP